MRVYGTTHPKRPPSLQSPRTIMNSVPLRIVVSIAIALFAAGLSSCKKPVADSGANSESESETAAPVSGEETKGATPAPSTALATPEPNYLAPAGVYFLTKRVSIPSDDGVIGLVPGTKAIKQEDGRYLADGHLLEIPANELTNDLRVAMKLSNLDQASQAAIRQTFAQSQQSAPSQQGSSSRQSTATQTKTTNAPQAPQAPQRPPPAAYVPGVNTRNNLGTSTSIGASHSKTADGILWQKSPDGVWWVPVKRLDGKSMGYVPKHMVR
jgi:hypothetical protein